MIADDDVVYRRIFSANTYPATSTNPKKQPGAVNSTAFVEYKNPMQQISVELARLTTLDDCIGRGRPGQGVAALTVVDIRAIGLDVHHTPEYGLTVAHCDIVHPLPDRRIEMSHCRELARAARVVHLPTLPAA